MQPKIETSIPLMATGICDFHSSSIFLNFEPPTTACMEQAQYT